MKWTLGKSLLLFSFFMAPFVHADETDWFFKPYLGIDAGAQRLSWEPGYGERHFKEHYPYANFHAGVMLHQYFGFEFGYEHMFSQARRQYYGQAPASPVLGFNAFAGGGAQTYVSQAKINGFNLNAIFSYPLSEKTQVFASLGANWARLHVSTELFDATALNERPVYWQSDRKAIARIGFGLRHHILPNLGGRLTYMWEHTATLKASIFPGQDIANVNDPTSDAHRFSVRPKDSHIIMAGLFYKGAWA